jgi:hypothetical protein
MTMDQPLSLYDTSAALALIDPWLRAHLPNLDATVTRRFVQLVTGIFEQRSLLLETIAESTAFTGTDSSNVTQVRRIIRDARITFKDVYYPLLECLIAELPNDVLELTMDEPAIRATTVSCKSGSPPMASACPWASTSSSVGVAVEDPR